MYEAFVASHISTEEQVSSINDKFMNYIEELGKAWDNDTGLFYKIRYGHFDEDQYEKNLELLKSISFENIDHIPKEAVRLLWFIPTFMEWNKHRQKEIDIDIYQQKITSFQNELERILGMP